MKQFHRNILIKLREAIVQDLDVANGVIGPLEADCILKPEDLTHIEARETKEAQAEFLLDILPNRGPNAFRTFHQALKEHYFWLSNEMNDLLMADGTDAVDSVGERIPILPPVSPLTVVREQKIQQLTNALEKLSPRGYVVIHGMKGFGRSRLAINVLSDTSVHRNLFNSQIFWVRFGCKEKVSPYTDRLEDEILKQLNNLYHQIENDPQTWTDDNSGFGKDQLRKFLGKYFNDYRNALLVLDDVWDKAIIDTFDFNCKTLVITIDLGVLGERHKEIVEMRHGFTEAESLNLFGQVLGVESHELPLEAKEIHNECNGMPILIDMFAAHFADYKEELTQDSTRNRWKYYLQWLRNKDATNKSVKDLLEKQEAIFEMCIDRLPETTRDRYKSLAIFSEDVNISPKTIEILWGETIHSASEQMQELCHKSLAARQWNKELETYVFGVHDLLLCYLRKKLTPEQLSNLHKNLIEKYRVYCKGDFSKLPTDNYSFSYIGHHLEQANMFSEFKNLYLDFNFINAKICNSGINDLLIDLKKYRKYITEGSAEVEAKVVDVEKFLSTQVKILAEHRRRKCLDLVQIGMNHNIHGYFQKTAQQLAESQSMHLYLCHEQHHRIEEHHNGVEVPIELTTVNFTDDENKILLGSDHGVVILWDTNTRRHFTFCGHDEKSKITKIIVNEPNYWHTLTSEEDFFVALNDQGVIKRFTLNIEEYGNNSNDDVIQLRSPREKQISYNYIHKIPEDQSRTTYDLSDCSMTDIADIALTRDNKKLAACTRKGYYRVWDINGRILCTTHVQKHGTDLLTFVHEVSLLFFFDAEEGVIIVHSPRNNSAYEHASIYRPGRDTGKVRKGLKGKKAIYFQEIKTDRSSDIEILLVTNLETVHFECKYTELGAISSPSTRIILSIDPELNPGSEFTAATLTHDNQYIVIADSEGFIKVYSIPNSIDPKAVYSGKTRMNCIDSYYFTNDSHSIIAGLNRLTYKWAFKCESNLPQSVRIPKFDALMQSDNQLDVVAQVKGKKILVFEGNEQIAETKPIDVGDIVDLHVCQDGPRVLYVKKIGHLDSFKYEIRIFNYKTHQDRMIQSVNTYKGPIRFLKLNDMYLPVWKNDGNIEIATNLGILSLSLSAENILNLHTIDKEYVITVSDTGTIIIWKVSETEWAKISELRGHMIPNVCYSTLNSQEDMLALLKSTGEMAIYNIEKKESKNDVQFIIERFMAYNFRKSLTCGSFSPDGTLLALGMDNGTISIYDVYSNRFYNDLSLHCYPVLQLHWAPESIGAPILLSVNCEDMAWWNISLLQEDKKLNRPSRAGIPRSSTTPTFGISPRGSMRLSASQSAAADLSKLTEKLEKNASNENNDSDEEKTRQFWCSKVTKDQNNPGLLRLIQLPHSCRPKVCVSCDFKKFLLVDSHGSINTYKLFGL
uniref:Apaf1_1 protein n=2 Tax=Fopius arisanus TaxID=64838 RepID=A0A0C9RL69_9HYME